MGKLKGLNEVLTEEEISSILVESFPDTSQEIEFEAFLQVLSSLSTSLFFLFSTLDIRWELKYKC